MHSHCFGLHILQSESKLFCNDNAWKQHKCKGKQQNFCKARKFCEAPYSNNVTFFKLGFTAYKAVVLKNIYQSNTYRKDLSWPRFNNEPRVQEKQQLKDQQFCMFVNGLIECHLLPYVRSKFYL